MNQTWICNYVWQWARAWFVFTIKLNEQVSKSLSIGSFIVPHIR